MFARRLAQRIFKRFILRLGQLQEEFFAFRAATAENAVEAAEKLLKVLKKKVSQQNQILVTESLTKQEAISNLTQSVIKSLMKFKRNLTASEMESVILTSIIKQKVKVHAKDKWQLSRKGLQEVSDDFRLIHDFYYGSQNQDLHQQATIFGELFLSDGEQVAYKELEGKDDEKGKFLLDKARPKMQPIWYSWYRCAGYCKQQIITSRPPMDTG